MVQIFVKYHINFETNFIYRYKTNDANWVRKIAPNSLQTSDKKIKFVISVAKS